MIMNAAAADVINILAMLVSSYMVHRNEILDRKMKRFFLFAALFTVVAIAAEIGTIYCSAGTVRLRTAHVLFNVVGFSLSPFISLFIALAFCNHTSRLKTSLFLPLAINFILTALSPAFGFGFSVSETNVYQRGPLFFVYIFSYIWGMSILFRETLIITRRYQSKNRYTLFLLFAFILAGTSVQILLPSVFTTWSCVALAIIIYYAYFCELTEKHDILTNLLNRRAYECEVNRLKTSERAVVFLFDVDAFKAINDTYGHQYGDECLHTIAAAIRETFSSVGLCYRIGGDEFCVLSEALDREKAADHLRLFLCNLERIQEKDARIPAVSFGYSLYQKSAGSIEQAISAADLEMYAHKNGQKGMPVS